MGLFHGALDVALDALDDDGGLLRRSIGSVGFLRHHMEPQSVCKAEVPNGREEDADRVVAAATEIVAKRLGAQESKVTAASSGGLLRPSRPTTSARAMLPRAVTTGRAAEALAILGSGAERLRVKLHRPTRSGRLRRPRRPSKCRRGSCRCWPTSPAVQRRPLRFVALGTKRRLR